MITGPESPVLGIATYTGLAAGLGLLYIVAKVIYNVYFHPLAKYPGPPLAAVSDIWYALHWTSGRWPFTMSKLHQKYGEVMRIGPNEISFATPAAIKDIYGHATKGKKLFLKSIWYDHGSANPGIGLVRDPAVHQVQRKSLSHAFSTKSLRDQEDIVHRYLDLLVSQLAKHGGPSSDGINMPEAFNWFTFDVIGDLAFGESFDAVATLKTNYWVSILIDASFFGNTISLCKRLPWFKLVLPFVLPISKLKKDAKTHYALTEEKLQKRLKGSNERADFFSHILKTKDRLYSPEMLHSQANTLIVAGSDTTSSFLNVTMYYLFKHPNTLQTLQKELRSVFTSLDEITGDSTSHEKTPYLWGCVEEGLRLGSPAAFGLPRICPGAVIAGHAIPAGVTVSCDMWALQHDPKHWTDVDAFRPERWLGEGLPGDNKAAFQPFSIGPRACIGVNLAYLEGRLAMAKLAWALDWELVTTDVNWEENAKFAMFWKHPEMKVRFRPYEKYAPL